jgi:hypothetical protein
MQRVGCGGCDGSAKLAGPQRSVTAIHRSRSAETYFRCGAPTLKRVRTRVAVSRRSHSPPPPTRRSGPVCRLDDGRTRLPRTRLPCSYAAGRNLPSLSLSVTSGFSVSVGLTVHPPPRGALSRILDVADGERALDRKLGSAAGPPNGSSMERSKPSRLLLGQLPLGPSLLRPPRPRHR